MVYPFLSVLSSLSETGSYSVSLCCLGTHNVVQAASGWVIGVKYHVLINETKQNKAKIRPESVYANLKNNA